MAEPAIASTQYGDLKGTVSLDGYDGPFLRELAGKAQIPRGYFPVGFTAYSERPAESGRWRVGVLACDADLSGWTPESVAALAAQDGKVKVFKFPVELSFEEFLGLVKRVQVVAFLKCIRDVPVEIIDDE